MAIQPVPSVVTLPAAPDPNNRATFNTLSYPWAVAQVQLRTDLIGLADNMLNNANEVVSIAADVTTKQGIASTAATNAGTYASNAFTYMNAAATSALTAVNAPGTAGTSTSSVTLSVGLKSIVTQTGKAWSVGQTVNLARTSAPTTSKAVATIAAYNSGTGAMDLNIAATADITGAGTFTDWTISLAGLTGAAGAAGAAGTVAMGRKTITGTDTLGVADLGKITTCTGTNDYTVTLAAAATLGANWFVPIRNDGTGTVTLAHASIDGATSKALNPGDVLYLQCDGSDVRTVKIDGDPRFGTPGAATVVNSTTINGLTVCTLSSTLALLMYSDNGNINYLRAISRTGNALTIGSAVNLGISSVFKYVLKRLTNTSAVLAMQASSQVQVREITVSGTTPTLGTANTAVSGTTDNAIDVVVDSATKIVVFFNHSAALYGCVYDLAGGTWTNQAAATLDTDGSYSQGFYNISAVKADTGKAVLSYQKTASVPQSTVALATYTATTPTFRHAFDMYFGANFNASALLEWGTGKALLIFSNMGIVSSTGAWKAVHAIELSVSGNFLNPGPTSTLPYVEMTTTHTYSKQAAAITAGNRLLYVGRERNAAHVIAAGAKGNVVLPLQGMALNSPGSSSNTGAQAVAVFDADWALAVYQDSSNSFYLTAKAIDLGSL